MYTGGGGGGGVIKCTTSLPTRNSLSEIKKKLNEGYPVTVSNIDVCVCVIYHAAFCVAHQKPGLPSIRCSVPFTNLGRTRKQGFSQDFRMGCPNYTFRVNWVSQFLFIPLHYTKKYGYQGVQNQQQGV